MERESVWLPGFLPVLVVVVVAMVRRTQPGNQLLVPVYNLKLRDYQLEGVKWLGEYFVYIYMYICIYVHLYIYVSVWYIYI